MDEFNEFDNTDECNESDNRDEIEDSDIRQQLAGLTKLAELHEMEREDVGLIVVKLNEQNQKLRLMLSSLGVDPDSVLDSSGELGLDGMEGIVEIEDLREEVANAKKTSGKFGFFFVCKKKKGKKMPKTGIEPVTFRSSV